MYENKNEQLNYKTST